MKQYNFELKGRKGYFIVLIVGMIASVIIFNSGYELIAAGTITLTIIMLWQIKEQSERPIFDERDISLAEESTHQAVMLSGAVLGVVMIGISAGMGLGYMSYPDWIGPYYLAWGSIMLLTISIEVLKRYGLIE